MVQAVDNGKTVVRLHTGDPCIYGAIREQMDILDEKGIPYDYCPGVSAFCGAAGALNLEYTLPDISQSVVITRMEGRTPVPPKESIQSFAAHQATMVVFLSTGMLEELSKRLIEGGYTEDTPAAIVYKATWEDEKKFICTVCGYIHEGDSAPEKCPLCKAPASKFNEMVESEGGLEFVDEHVIGVAKGCDEEMIKDLNNHFMGECTEVGMYLAMSRQADREGYPEVAEAFKRYAWEEAEHAAKFAELLGDCVWDTKTNLEKRMNAESGACADKKRIATRAKALNLDAIHDTVHEMAKDEARHGKGFEGLYNRYFKK